MDVTYVTAYFNIRKLESNKYEGETYCAPTCYLEYTRKLLSLPLNFVIYVEEEFEPWVKEVRKDLDDKTRIVVMKLEDLPLYQFYQRLTENNRNSHVVNLDPRKFTDLFLLVINSKVDLVSDAIEKNPFNTKYYAWIDFRALHLSWVPPSFFFEVIPKYLDERIRINLMHYCNKDEIKDKKEYYRVNNKNIVAGAFWIGSRTSILEFINLYKEELAWCLENDIAPSEEQVIGVIVTFYPEKFNFYAGDYAQSLSSYDGVAGAKHLPLASLDKAFHYGSHTITQQIAFNLLEGVNKGKINLNNLQLYNCYYYQYVALYWLGQRLHAKRICYEMIKDERISREIVSHRHFLLDNLSYLRDEELLGQVRNLNPTNQIICIGYFHPKNKKGLELMNLPLTFSSSLEEAKQDCYSVVLLPDQYYHPSIFPNKKILYGPHHWVFPEGPLTKNNDDNTYKHCAYNLLSNWVKQVFSEFSPLCCKGVILPFPVDIDKFSPTPLHSERSEILVYSKMRHPSCLEIIKPYLNSCKVNYITYGYYQEEEYIKILNRCKWGIWIGCSESQGFALQEALAMNVPLLVWDVTSMHTTYIRDNFIYLQDEKLSVKKLEATTTPYWDDRCGLRVKSGDEVLAFLPLFEKNVEKGEYHPRDYILEHLSPKVCRENWLQFFQQL